MCDVDESDDQPLGYLMYRVMAALRPQAVAALRPLGISLPEVVCMRILSVNPGLTSAELARDNHVSAQAMNQVLHGLQDRGAVTRPGSTLPGRPLPAQLTRQGKALLKRAEAAIHTADRHLSHLTAGSNANSNGSSRPENPPLTDPTTPTLDDRGPDAVKPPVGCRGPLRGWPGESVAANRAS